MSYCICMSKLQPVRGTHDIMNEDSRRHRFITHTALRIAERYGFSEISTPIFEFTEVFKRTLGDASDIVNKEMYTFSDRSGDELTLRPEGTASIARAFISQGLSQHTPVKLFYSGPMFRHERPQKGRMRQFHQFGVEVLGSEKTIVEIELLSLAHAVLQEIGVRHRCYLEINSIGDAESRAQYRKALVEFLSDHNDQLSEDSQRRLKINPLRVLDSKDESDRKLLKNAPLLPDHLNSESSDLFATVCEGLKELSIGFEVNPLLVRGLDYYNHTVFEFKSRELGAQDAILSGGRYDHLVSTMGGPETPGVGWAAGIERISMLIKKDMEHPLPISIIPVGEAAEKAAISLCHELRIQGITIDMAYSGNLSKRMKKANKIGAKVALILGEEELQSEQITIKDLDTRAQTKMKRDNLSSQLRDYFDKRKRKDAHLQNGPSHF